MGCEGLCLADGAKFVGAAVGALSAGSIPALGDDVAAALQATSAELAGPAPDHQAETSFLFSLRVAQPGFLQASHNPMCEPSIPRGRGPVHGRSVVVAL